MGQTRPDGVRRIAVFAPDYLDYVHRLVDGIVAWQAERNDIQIKDYRFKLGDLDDRGLFNEPPPWHGQADGVIAYVGPQDGVGEWLARGGAPVVNTSADRSPEIPTVHSDGRSIAALAVDHFLSLGFRSFACVGHELSPGAASRERAFAAELHARGFALSCCRVLARLDGPVRDGARRLAADPRLQSFLLRQPKPLAVLCQNDYYAAGVATACQKVGLSIPGTVGVLGVSDVAAARECDPPLSSVRLPGESIGFQAMELLERLMNGEPAPESPIEVAAVEISIRESTNPEIPRDADIDRAVQLMRDLACHEGIDVNAILKTLHVSRKTFERRCQDAIGHPPGEEIRRVRQARAEELLATTSLSVTRVGRMVGFPRPSMFARFFKTRSGYTPLQFRRSVVSEANGRSRAHHDGN